MDSYNRTFDEIQIMGRETINENEVYIKIRLQDMYVPFI
jgi:hypothetical protein